MLLTSKYFKGTVENLLTVKQEKLLTVKQDVDVTNKYCRDVTEERSIASSCKSFCGEFAN